jgi:cyclopropane-fatty-acyl-phospholipid synthase
VNAAQRLTPLLSRLLGPEAPLRIEFWDGSAFGPAGASARVVMHSPRALQRILRSPGELGSGRAYVSGDLDIDGDVYAVLALHDVRTDLRLGTGEWFAALRAAAGVGALRPGRIPIVPEEARLHGRRHSRARDAAAISHHYDVGNDFYRIVLGESMTYSCAYFASPDQPLADAQRDKHELICRKLRLREGERLLDVGCGWGSMAIHAATTRRAHVVGVTLSQPQADLAAKRAADAGVGDLVEIRVQDERDTSDGLYDAICSVGMFEHVGAERLSEYFTHLHALLRPQGRLLNHGISRPPASGKSRFARKSFIDSFVFPDGELHEAGRVVSCMQESGFEVRDVESLREHYALTLRHWVHNLEAQRDEAVRLAGEGRYRVWRLYMAAAAVNFEAGRTQVNQMLGARSDDGTSGVPLRRSDTVL